MSGSDVPFGTYSVYNIAMCHVLQIMFKLVYWYVRLGALGELLLTVSGRHNLWWYVSCGSHSKACWSALLSG